MDDEFRKLFQIKETLQFNNPKMLMYFLRNLGTIFLIKDEVLMDQNFNCEGRVIEIVTMDDVIYQINFPLCDDFSYDCYCDYKSIGINLCQANKKTIIMMNELYNPNEAIINKIKSFPEHYFDGYSK